MSKKLIGLIMFIVLLFPAFSFATAPDHTYTVTKLTSGNRQMYLFEVSWEADDGTGAIANITIPASTLGQFKGCYLIRVITDPGATAPTDNYDIVLNDAYGFDVMEGDLANRDTANTETIDVSIPIYGQLTAVFTNNTDVSALGKLILLIAW